MADKGDRIFTRDFILLAVGNFIVVSVYFLLMTSMALYAVEQYGAGDSIAGLTASIFLVGAVIGRIVSGRYSEYFGLRRLTLFALVVQVVMMALYFASDIGVWFLIAVRLVHGLSFGIANTTLPAMAVEGLPWNRIGEGTGYFMLSNSLGVGIGPLMTVLVAAGFDFSLLFVICEVLVVALLGLTLLVKHGRGVPMGKKPGRFTVGSVIDLSTVKFSVFMFIVAVSYSSLNSFINVYATGLGMGFYAPFVFLVYSVVLLLSRPLTGKLMDRFGENAVLYPSIACMAVGLVIAATAQNVPMLLSCGIFMALGFGTCMSIGQATAVKHTTSGNSTLAISTFFLLCDAGCGLGPFFLGFVAGAEGFRAMYWLCAGIAVVALIYYHFFHGRRSIAGKAPSEFPEGHGGGGGHV